MWISIPPKPGTCQSGNAYLRIPIYELEYWLHCVENASLMWSSARFLTDAQCLGAFDEVEFEDQWT